MLNSARKKIVNSIILAVGISSINLHAESFTECPAEAFLIQDKLANLYSVQLATGFYEKSSPLDWNQEKMNALAFSVHDRYLYAFNHVNYIYIEGTAITHLSTS
jgi:hypothetical protein